ncbi:unnamed protein product [Chondrus crispus]|uniref:Uncharacterized protein n=1 Tax=Chondrus crispus TaxID=2769 RepID=R7Q9B1_CHOCR|nr:unnamed protein product [Chondrus crispus]CDF34639.1 unnamed protein product [Chondrus crispus]|eukprot:XP_005714458.1 unnamed protein product [Chondrus crispus]
MSYCNRHAWVAAQTHTDYEPHRLAPPSTLTHLQRGRRCHLIRLIFAANQNNQGNQGNQDSTLPCYPSCIQL